MSKPITKVLPFIIMVCAYAVSGCLLSANGTPTASCAEFLNEIPGRAGSSPVSYDLERLLGISSSDKLTAAYNSLESIDSGCAPGEIVPADPEDIMAPWGARGYVDVAAGVSGTARWIQFVYPSIGDSGPGLASSVVFYDKPGYPKATRLVSEFHSWEGASVLRSVMFEGEIVSCRQHVEYYVYDQDGDISGELESPMRSECELTSATYPYP